MGVLGGGRPLPVPKGELLCVVCVKPSSPKEKLRGKFDGKGGEGTGLFDLFFLSEEIVRRIFMWGK